MTRAELKYNPYLQQTIIRFNGRNPRINSRVEKFYNSNLQDWVDDIPEIFSEEMNGYDFELDFSGTELDFKEVKESFEHAEIPERNVRILHKGKLGGRLEKIEQIMGLRKWLEGNPNDYFDYKRFCEDNNILFEGTYSLIVLQDENARLSASVWDDVSVEGIKETAELEDTDLLHVPIVVMIGDDNILQIQSITDFLKKRNDVSDNQVFFLIDSNLDLDIIKRTLMDLDFDDPQIVEDICSERIKKYFELYPYTDYINQSLTILGKEATLVEEHLNEVNEIKETANTDTQKKIAILENRISKLKEADAQIVNRSSVDLPSEFSQAKIELYSKILNWRKKKTKITSDSEANSLSVELSKAVSSAYNDFSRTIAKAENECISGIKDELKRMYLNGDYDQDYLPEDIEPEKFNILHTPRIENELMDIFEYYPVMRKDQGLFFMQKSSGENIEMEMETAYYVQKWCEYALGVVEKMADSLIKTRTEAIQKYDEQLARAYQKHLTDQNEKLEYEKDTSSQHLSTEERQIQIDKEWLDSFMNQLETIEGGRDTWMK